MSWFLFALISTFGWGLADLFYKKGSEEDDRYSHLKIAVWVGLVMGVCSFCLLPFSESSFSVASLTQNIFRYSPVSLAYIISMIIGYAGMRYLEISVISPVQNASGALSTIAMAIWFLFTGKITHLGDEFSPLDLIGTGFIIIGVLSLAIAEQHLKRKEILLEEKKYRFGALALIFPLLYCLFDTIGTAGDGILLDEETGLGLGELDVLIVYGLTFLLIGLGSWVFLLLKQKRLYNPFSKTEIPKGIAACCEEFGQFFYVFAMAEKPMLAAPMIASYCIVSVILSRLFLKERLERPRLLCVITVIIGIVLLGIAEGLAEA